MYYIYTSMKAITYISITLNIIFVVFVAILIIALWQLGLFPFSSSTQVAQLPSVFEESNQEYNLEVIADNLEIPWAVAHIDTNTKLVTERSGTVRLVENKIVLEQPVYEIPNVVVEGEAGLMSMLLHPNFEENNYVYIYFSYSNTNDETTLKVSRFEYINKKFGNEFVVIDNIPYGQFHAGGEMAFGPDGKLYITTGDVTDRNLAQDIQSLAGKTLRLNDDGTIPNDNPFAYEETVLDSIYTVGHRNSQGIDWHPETNIQYQSDHGPSGFDGGTGQDEINLIEAGRNYGWPVIRGDETQEGLETPIIQYSPAIAPSSIAFYDGAMFPELQNKLLVAALAGEGILVLTIEGDQIIDEFRLLNENIGRIRDISIDTDGSIYFTTSNTDGRGDERENDDKIYRIYR